MKIIQFLGRIEGSGVTRYIIELANALKSIGHDVEAIYFNNDLKPENDMQNIPGLICMNYSDELFNKLNSADIIFINSLISVRANKENRNNFYKTIKNVTGPIKVMFCNDHNMSGIRAYYGDEYVTNPDLLVKHIDKFVTFSPYAPIIQKIAEVYPDIMNKYVHMQHPYTFSDTPFVDFDDKYRRVSYLGRIATFKDPMRLLRTRDEFFKNNYELEMRGIAKTIFSSTVPDLIYKINDKKERVGKSDVTIDLTTSTFLNRYLNAKCPNENPALIHWSDREKDKIYLFGRYKREDGMNAIKYSLYGCDFCYDRKNPLIFGDNIEYCVAEIVDMGTIPLVDYSTMEHCMKYENNVRTNISFLDLPSGIALKADCSNINEVIDKLNYLSSDKNAYDKYRTECLSLYKEHYDPKRVAIRLIEDLTMESNKHALDEFNYKSKKVFSLF